MAIYGASQIQKITPGGVVTTLAGSGHDGSANGTGSAASFYGPYGIAMDSSGNIYVADTWNQLIRKITSGGVVTTLAGGGAGFDSNGFAIPGNANGTGTAASFSFPEGVAVDSLGNVYVADSGNDLIRKITSGGVVTTLAGGGSGTATNGSGTAASFSEPTGVAVDSSGNVYVADSHNNLIRKITQ
jgi:sugar lactone lactonase YvrE